MTPSLGRSAIRLVPSRAPRDDTGKVVRTCDLCGGDNFRTLLSTPDLTEGVAPGIHHLRQCVCCGLALLSPRPPRGSIADVYPRKYLPHAPIAASSLAWWQRRASGQRQSSAFMRVLTALRQEIAFHLVPAVRPGSAVLDVGCGSGAFLDVLRQLGCSTAGVDASPVAVARARAKGHAVELASAEDLPFSDRGFDVVQLNHVLEHTHSPRQALESARRVLRPDGQLLLAVPNFGGLQARLFGRCWSGLDLPRHLYQFDRSTLARYLHETGFRVRRMWTRTGATSIPKSLRLCANHVLGTRWRRDPAWLVALFEPVALLASVVGAFGRGRDLRVVAEPRG